MRFSRTMKQKTRPETRVKYISFHFRNQKLVGSTMPAVKKYYSSRRKIVFTRPWMTFLSAAHPSASAHWYQLSPVNLLSVKANRNTLIEAIGISARELSIPRRVRQCSVRAFYVSHRFCDRRHVAQWRVIGSHATWLTSSKSQISTTANCWLSLYRVAV